MINEAGFNSAFYYFRYDRKVRDLAISKSSFLSKVDDGLGSLSIERYISRRFDSYSHTNIFRN